MGRASHEHGKRKNTKAYLVAVLSLLSFPLMAQETLVDRIAAIVNGKPVMYSEIQKKIKKGQPVSLSQYPAKDSDSDYDKALNDEINYQLVLQKIEEFEIEISDADVDAEIQAFLKQRNLSPAGLREALRGQGMTYEEYQKDFRNQMIMRKFQGRVISPLIKITDKDIENYYIKKTGSTSENVRLRLRKIFISIPSGAVTAVRKAKEDRAKEVYGKLENGMDFVEAAKIYSDDPGAKESGGLMPAVKLNDLAAVIRSNLEALGIGAFTKPIETPGGYFIFYVEKRQFAGSDDFGRQKKKLEFELRSLELESQTMKWLAEERRRSKIEIIK